MPLINDILFDRLNKRSVLRSSVLRTINAAVNAALPHARVICYSSSEVICALYGVYNHSFQSYKKTRKAAAWLLRLVFLALFIIDLYQNVYYIYKILVKDGTFLTFVELLYYLAHAYLSMESAVIIIFAQPAVNFKYIRSSADWNVKAFVIGVALTVPLTLKVFYDFSEIAEKANTRIIFIYFCGVFVFLVQVPALLFYLQYLEKTRSDLKAIHDTVRKSIAQQRLGSFQSTISRLVDRKQDVRTMIHDMNIVYRRFVLVKFLSIFCSVTLQVGLSICDSSGLSLADLLSGILFDAILKLVETYVICRSGTILERWCHETERLLYERLLVSKPSDYESLGNLRRQLRYSDDRDELEMCFGFRINLVSLMSFFSTIITCCAVTLQFDSRVMSAINNAARVSV